MKTVILLHSPDVAFVERLPALLAARPWAEDVSRIAVHLPIADSEPEPEPLPCDAVIEIWSATPVHMQIAADPALAEALLDIRASRELVGKEGDGRAAPGVAPGLSHLSFIEALAGLPRTEVERHWSDHVPLANRIHVGMTRYVQDRFMLPHDASTRWFGMAHMHFPDEHALANGLFRTPEDVEVIRADVAEFISGYASMVAIEHVVKG